MKKLMIMLSFIILTLVGCNNNETGLEDRTLGLSSFDPTISEKEQDKADIKFASNMLVFNFTPGNEVTLMYNSNEYSGEYTLEDNTLTVDLEDQGNTLRLVFSDFKETPDEYYSYTGKIETGELDTSDEVSQLSNVVDNINVGESYMFLEE